MAATSGRPSTPFLNYSQAFVGSPSQPKPQPLPKPSLRCTTKQIGLRHGLGVRLWTIVEHCQFWTTARNTDSLLKGAHCYAYTSADSCSLFNVVIHS